MNSNNMNKKKVVWCMIEIVRKNRTTYKLFRADRSNRKIESGKCLIIAFQSRQDQREWKKNL